MCLNTVDKVKNFPKSQIGYKIYYKDGYKYQCENYFFPLSLYLGETYKDNNRKWIHSDKRTRYKNFKKYYPGFHIYSSLRAAKSQKCSVTHIVKVKYDNVVATGKQYGKKVIVARKITLLKEIIDASI
jgi:hypothetical protein